MSAVGVSTLLWQGQDPAPTPTDQVRTPAFPITCICIQCLLLYMIQQPTGTIPSQAVLDVALMQRGLAELASRMQLVNSTALSLTEASRNVCCAICGNWHCLCLTVLVLT
jgi:hypothetical protein